MMRKSVFQASFEESLNLENDEFRKLQDAQHLKTAKHFDKGSSSLRFKLYSFILAAVFVIGLNFAVFVISVMLHDDAEELRVPIYEKSFLTAEVFLIGLFLWLLLVLAGKAIKLNYILPYRYNFHIFTAMIWFLLELDLLFTDFLLPALSFFWVGAIYAFMIFLAYWMLVVKLKYLRRLLYHEAATPALQDKVAGLMAVYGMGILGVGIMIKLMLGSSSLELSASIQAFGFLLAWVIINVGSIVAVIFVGFPYFLLAYYKCKYSEEYRKREGKSLEDWYGRRFLRQHKELLENG
jgi:hypothetical protein